MNMKIILISLFWLFLIGISSYSYAQYSVVDSNTIVPEVMLQFVIRDSDGNLLTYIEAKQIIVIYPLELKEFLDKQPKKLFIKDDKAFEIIQWQGRTENFNKQHAWSQFNLWVTLQAEPEIVLVVRHNSYQTQPGDTIAVYWTIIRPAT